MSGISRSKACLNYEASANGLQELLKALQRSEDPLEQLEAKVTAMVPCGCNVLCGLENGSLLLVETSPVLAAYQFQSMSTKISPVLCIAATNDGRCISASAETLVVWDVASYTETAKLEGHTGIVTCLALVGETRCVSGARDCTLRVWDLKMYREVAKLEGHTRPVECVVVLKDGRCVSGARDKTLRVWDITNYRELAKLQGHSDDVMWVAAAGDGRCVAGVFGNAFSVWNVATCTETAKLEGPSYVCRDIAVTADGRCICGSSDLSLRVWNLTEYRELARLEGHTAQIECVAVTRDGRCVSGGRDNTLRLWDLTDYVELAKIEGHNDSVNFVTVVDSGWCVSAACDKTLRVWDLSERLELASLQGHTRGVQCVAVTTDNRCVSGACDRTLRVWDLANYRELAVMEGHTREVLCVATTYDGRCVSGARDRSVRVWDLTNYCELAALQGHTRDVQCIAVTKDEKCISGSDDQSVRVWDLTLYEVLAQLYIHNAEVMCVAVMDDGRCVSGSWDSVLIVWDVDRYQEIAKMEEPSTAARCIALTRDGRCVCPTRSGGLRVWDFEEYVELTLLEGHSEAVRSIATLGEGLCVSGSEDRSLRVWDLTNFGEVAQIEAHTSHVTCIALTPDGRCVSGSSDKTLRVWDLLNLTGSFSSANDFSKAGLPSHLKVNIQYFREGRRRHASIAKMPFRPFGFNALHISVCGNYHETLRLYIREDGVPLIRGIFGSPLTLALERHEADCIEVILDYLIDRVSHTDASLEFAAVTDDLPALLTFSSSRVCTLYSLLLRPSTQYPEPRYISPKVVLPVTEHLDYRLVLLSRYHNSRKAQPELVAFQVSVPLWNFSLGSKQSVQMLRALRDSRNKHILSTDYVRTVIKDKWKKYLPFTFGIAVLNFCQVALLIGALLYGWPILICAFLDLSCVFCIYDIARALVGGLEFFLDVECWLTSVKGGLSLWWGYAIYLEVEPAKMLTLLVLMLHFIEGFMQLRTFKMVRSCVYLSSEVLRGTLCFLFMLAYSAAGLTVLAALLTSPSLSELLPSIINFECFDFTLLSAFECFILVGATTADMIILISLFGSAIGDAYRKAGRTKRKNNLHHQLKVVLGYETLMLWRKDEGKRRIILTCRKCDTTHQESSDILQVSQSIRSDIRDLTNALSGIERRIQRTEAKLEEKLSVVERKTTDHGGKIQDKLNEMQAHLENRLKALEASIEEKFAELNERREESPYEKMGDEQPDVEESLRQKLADMESKMEAMVSLMQSRT